MSRWLVVKDRPKWMEKRGLIGFQDNGATGMGVSRYAMDPLYTPHDIPTVVGARYFPPDPDHDPETDAELPMVVGSRYAGGKEAYRLNVYKEARENRAKFGFSHSDIKDLEKGSK